LRRQPPPAGGWLCDAFLKSGRIVVRTDIEVAETALVNSTTRAHTEPNTYSYTLSGYLYPTGLGTTLYVDDIVLQ
jgi:hypothetical protein